MTRAQILHQVRQYCEPKYQEIDHWAHGIAHIKRVVKNGERICREEKVRSKDAFLVALACWLHDLGRLDEEINTSFSNSIHAEESYIRSKKVLYPYKKIIGRESLYNILEAIREHSLPKLKHPHNRIAQILQDADRGASINLVGLISMITYREIIDWPPVTSKVQARRELPKLTRELLKRDKVKEVIQTGQVVSEFYYGTKKKNLKGVIVEPLHTSSARRLFKADLKEVEHYLSYLETLV